MNDVLDFSKIEAKKLDLETVDFDLQELLDDFSSSVGEAAHAKRLELCCSTGPRSADARSWRPGPPAAILANLVGNAIKFTSTGEVAVRALLVQESESDCLLRFSVCDTGIGIPEDKISLLFGKFSQVDSSTTRKYGGTGLGLAISMELAQMMGGAVGVTSEIGKGSQFWFTVRLEKPFDQPLQKQTGEKIEASTAANLCGLRALIVDDNATSRAMLTMMMTSWGMRPTEVEGGPWALQTLYQALEKGDPFRVAVIDVQMPGMDGQALGQAINVDQRLSDLRTVMLRSPGHPLSVGFDATGMTNCLNKPIRRQDLLNLLSRLLSDNPQPIPTFDLIPEQWPSIAGVSGRILVAEDNLTNQEVVLGIIKKLGLHADAVADGAEAVRSLELIPYDLVLMDVMMPVMDGLEATRQIRNPLSAVLDHSVPIVAITANAMQQDRECCIAAGMNDFLPKPVSKEALIEAIRKWLAVGDVLQVASTGDRNRAHAADPRSYTTGRVYCSALWEIMN